MVLLSILFSTGIAGAENLTINKDGLAGISSVYTAKSLGKGHLAITASGDFSSGNTFVKRLVFIDSTLETGDKKDTVHPVSSLLQIRPAIALGVTDFLDFGISIPVYFDIIEKFSPEGGIGDLKLTGQMRVPGKKNRISDAALFAAVYVPVGNSSDGYFPRHTLYYKQNAGSDSIVNLTSRYSSHSVDIDLEALWRLNANWFGLYINSGCVFTSNRTIDNLLIMRAALEIRTSNYFAIFTEFTSECRFENVSDGFNITNDPLWIVPGFSVTTDNGAVLTLSGGVSLSSSKDIHFYDKSNEKRFTTKIQPEWKINLQVGWGGVVRNIDSDNDLVSENFDKCLKLKEDNDGFDDQDGCPDYDNDSDNVPDTIDKCPDAGEDFDKYEDSDGCPDMDNDQDRVVDSLDKCPNTAEDVDGVADLDGCPDYDNDHDGVADSIDKCISVTEDKDGFEDTDGCPDIDNDQDGIADSIDRCPDVPGIKEESGCVKAKEKTKEIQRGKIILAGVAFEPKTARLVESSKRILDHVYVSLNDYPAIKIEIRAHTDSVDGSVKNLALTNKRAAVIRDYFVNKGIASDRLIPVGKGDTEPIADNSVTPGRQLNNRIEVFRVD